MRFLAALATSDLACTHLFMQAAQVTNFGKDLKNGLVLGALLAAHWPSGSTGALLTRLHQGGQEGRHLKENQDLVVKAMQVGRVLFAALPTKAMRACTCHLLVKRYTVMTSTGSRLPVGRQQTRQEMAHPLNQSYSVFSHGRTEMGIPLSKQIERVAASLLSCRSCVCRMK